MEKEHGNVRNACRMTHNVNYVVVFDIGILTRKYENKKEKINVLHN